MIHMKVKPFLHVNHNVWFLFIVVFLNESRETAWEMYLPLLCHWGWKRRHEWTQDLYFCANNSKKWGPELVKRGPERTQDLYSGRYNEKGRSWVSEKRSRADSGPLFWTLQWKREVLSLWKELLRVSHFLKLLLQKPPLFLHHGEQCEEEEKKMGAKPFWFSDNLLTQCLQGLIVSEDQNVEEFHVQVTNYQGWGACRGSFEISWSHFRASY